MFFRAEGRQERGKRVRVGLGSPAASRPPLGKNASIPALRQNGQDKFVGNRN